MSAPSPRTEPPAPQNIDAEECVVGAILLAGVSGLEASQEVLARLQAQRLSDRHFYRFSLGRIYSAAGELVEKEIAPDVVAIADHLKRSGQLEEIGGTAKLVELAAIVPAISNAPHYARLVVEAARLRDEHVLGEKLARRALEPGGLAADPELRDALVRLLEPEVGATQLGGRTVDGWSFTREGKAVDILSNWGDRGDVLWARGEPLMIVGPDGVGKTSVGQQLTLARLTGGKLLGLPVAPAAGKVLYLAADRPAQAARSMARMISADDEEALRNRLVVHRGPLPLDIVKEPPWTLRQFVQEHGATDLVVDSLKDLAPELGKEEVGSAVSRAFQELLSADLELVVLHHQRKQQQGSPPPRKISDVYGSRWLTAGMGSIVLLWGEPGDLVVPFKHLKQPADEVGPYNVLHDHARGHTTVYEHADLETLLTNAAAGLTVKDAARLVFSKDEPSDNDIEKARRRLNSLVARNLAERRDDPDGTARYFPKTQ